MLSSVCHFFSRFFQNFRCGFGPKVVAVGPLVLVLVSFSLELQKGVQSNVASFFFPFF